MLGGRPAVRMGTAGNRMKGCQQMSSTELDRPSTKLVQYLAERAAIDGENIGFEVSARQLDAILKAETEDDLWEVVESGGTTGGRELEDVEMMVNSFIVRPSTGRFNAPLGHFIIINASKISDGEELLVNTGSPLIIGILRWYEAKGLLPFPFVIRGDDTPAGRRLWLEKIPSRAVAGETAE